MPDQPRWSNDSVVVRCAVAALLASTAATAARIDLWPTSTGPLDPGNHSQTYTEGLERIGWDLPSLGTLQVADGVAEGYYLTGQDDERDVNSLYLRAEEDEKLSAVFEFQYRTDLDAYLVVGMAFNYGTGTNDGYGSTWFLCVHEALYPEDTLSNGEVRVDVHKEHADFYHWRFSEDAEGGFLMRLVKESGDDGKTEDGPYLSIPEDVDERDSHSRYASLTDDESKAVRVKVALP